MILSKVYEDAEHRLERNEITLGEFERLVDIEVIEPKRGEWIDNTSETWTPSKKCSECGLVVHSVATDSTDFHAKTKMNFCPNCGADMREREGE